MENQKNAFCAKTSKLLSNLDNVSLKMDKIQCEMKIRAFLPTRVQRAQRDLNSKETHNI